MPKEKSSGAVVFRQKAGRSLFLLLHYPAGHWGIPKGHVEAGESEEQTAIREIGEETALENVKLDPNFRHEISYFFRRGKETIFKQVTIFLASAESGKVSLSPEHTEFLWLPFEEALERLTFKNTKNALKKAKAFLKPQ